MLYSDQVLKIYPKKSMFILKKNLRKFNENVNSNILKRTGQFFEIFIKFRVAL